MPMFGAGSIELLAARSLALLRSLTEFERQPFLDQASESPATKELARHTATRATHFAGAHSQVLHHTSLILCHNGELIGSQQDWEGPRQGTQGSVALLVSLNNCAAAASWLHAVAMTGQGPCRPGDETSQ